MAVNFGIKYSKEVEKVFTRASFVKQHTNGSLEFEGTKTVRVHQLQTIDEIDYKRTGANRYGDPADVQDTVSEYTMTQDKAFTGVVDKGDESDQAITGKAGKWLSQQLKERTTPNADKYAFKQFAQFGKVVEVATPTKSNIVSLFADMQEHFDDALVPEDNRIAYVTSRTYKLIAQSDEFLKLEKLGVESIGKGHVGELFGFAIIKVPTSYLPEGCHFMGVYKNAVAMPYKISETKIHKDPVGYSGSVIEGRHYYDAFVFAAQADGVYIAVDSGKKITDLAITIASGTATIAATNHADIRYTTDGSDPRFSMTAASYPSAGVKLESGSKIRAVAFPKDGYFTSDIKEATA